MAATADKTNLLDFNLEEMREYFVSIDEKPFRAAQLMKWIHQQFCDDFSQMTNLSKSLRQKLVESCEIHTPEIIFDQTSEDGTRKWLFKLDSGNSIETVFIPEDDRGTLCISSQIGCALDCSFCATGKQGFNRNLSVAEIIAQLWLANRALAENSDEERRITNVVMMGMGEPLLNYANVVRAMDIMMDDMAYGLSKRRVTLSTSGIVPALDRLMQRSDVSLAVSLHAPNDALRDELVPVNKKYPLKELMAACRRYVDGKSQRTKITFEYVMLAGVNDSPSHARELADLLKTVPAKVNLIPFNPFSGSDYVCSDRKTIDAFRDILKQKGIVTITRKTRGDDIDAACGQLAGKVNDKTRRTRKRELTLEVQS